MDENELDPWANAFKLNDLIFTQQEEVRAILLRFLDVLASFDRCFSAYEVQKEKAPEEDAVLRRMDMVRIQLIKALEEAGVTFRPCVGQVFDPYKHEAVEMQFAEKSEEYLILEEIVRGCEWRGEILCYAKVVVASSASPTIPNEQKESE